MRGMGHVDRREFGGRGVVECFGTLIGLFDLFTLLSLCNIIHESRK